MEQRPPGWKSIIDIQWACLKLTARWSLLTFLRVLYCWHWICGFGEAKAVRLTDGIEFSPWVRIPSLPCMSYVILVTSTCPVSISFPNGIITVPSSQNVVITHIYWSFPMCLSPSWRLITSLRQPHELMLLLLFSFYRVKYNLRHKGDLMPLLVKWWNQVSTQVSPALEPISLIISLKHFPGVMMIK